MATLRFAFEPGGPERVGIAWQGGWKDVALTLDGRRLGGFPDAKALRTGGSFALADGTRLEVKLAHLPMPELQVLRDGVPLPGSPSDPAERMRRAGQLVVALGVLSVLLGLAATLFDVGALRGMGFGIESAVLSAGFAALGVPARRGSLAALVAATAIYAIDGVVGLVLAAGTAAPGVPIARVLFAIPMVQGIQAGFALRRAPAPRRSAPPPPPAGLAPTPARPAAAAPDATIARRREIESRARDAAAVSVRDRGAQALRFVAPKLELLDAGVRVVALDGSRRDLAWEQVAEVLVRKLPPDPPWNGALLLDLVVRDAPPVRVVPATLVSFASLPGGAAPSRLENTRRLARLASERSSARLDPATQAFVAGSGHPATFASVHEFAAHDARFG
jgi:hypothetical protein